MQPQAELLVDARYGTGESPVWHVGEQALYWVDIPARALWRWDAASGQLSSWLAPEMLACIAWGGRAGRWADGCAGLWLGFGRGRRCGERVDLGVGHGKAGQRNSHGGGRGFQTPMVRLHDATR